jgi:hypothetical protein
MNVNLIPFRAARFAISLVMLLLVVGALGASAASASASPAADVTANQLTDNLLTSADLGVAMSLVDSTSAVHTPDAHLAGPDAVLAYTESLRAAYPTAQFAVTSFTPVGNLLIVDWQGTLGGDVVFPGRTLVTVENGSITEIWFLNRNSVAPVEGEPSSLPATYAPA